MSLRPSKLIKVITKVDLFTHYVRWNVLESVFLSCSCSILENSLCIWLSTDLLNSFSHVACHVDWSIIFCSLSGRIIWAKLSPQNGCFIVNLISTSVVELR